MLLYRVLSVLLLTVLLGAGPLTPAIGHAGFTESVRIAAVQPVGASVTLGASVTSDHFVVSSASPETAERTMALAQNAWKHLSGHFDRLPAEPVLIVVVEDAAEYENIQPATMTRGFATFGGNRIYLRGSELDQEVVTHELAHILLGKNIRPGFSVPDWFNEGFAQFVSRGDTHQRDIFYLVASGRLLPLQELDHVSALHGPNREFPTIQGLAVVHFLAQEYGQDKLWELVGRLSHSRTFSQALLDTYGRSDLELSEQWLLYAESEYGLFSIVGLETVGTAALGLLSLLAATVWITRKLRLRPRLTSPHDLSPWEVEQAERAAALLDSADARPLVRGDDVESDRRGP
ncbi:MAG: hypothetical protein LC667_19695 [Thioalkalivibrio sp.]|nr:hypothetical protein [Thioalkalivibrio sp.]